MKKKSDTKLVNYRSPIDLLTAFDDICRSNCRTRTSVLIALMSEYIANEGPKVRKRIDDLNALREFLGSSRSRPDSSARTGQLETPVSDGEKWGEHWSDPIPFFTDDGF